MRSLILLLIFSSLTHAYTTFESNCSVPTNSTNFVSSNGTRSTLDILWSCLFTIITCTWKVQHLNVPEQREGRNPGKWGTILWAVKRGWTSTRWMLITILAPEILLTKNVGDLEAVGDGVPWTRTHSLFANMGGFVIRRNSPKRDMIEAGTIKEKPVPESSIESEEGVREIPTESEELIPRSQTDSAESSQPVLIHLLTQDIVDLRSSGVLPKLPYITLEEINDRSKSDSLVRVITVAQIVWMIIQIIARASRSLAISQLEISVIAFAVCAIILYVVNWEKPKGVQLPITIISYPGPFPPQTMEIVEKDRNQNMNFLKILIWIVGGIFTFSDITKKRLGKHIPNAYNYETPLISKWFDLSKSDIFGLLLSTTVFSAVHIAAWNFAFPTHGESLLWKIAAVLCTAVGLVCIGVILLAYLVGSIWEDFAYVLAGLSLVLLTAGYIIYRLFLIVETFRCLFFLPPSAYVATWATNLPHLA
ncbi:hypothetical protein F5884DRAFT_820164 [Xylogone sp. PMI_703]|nr:hypothetical protein F5884DRAFT_820164 [Xylogone sp. PMI_703]